MKKIIAFVLAGIMVLASLCACGAEKPHEDNQGTADNLSGKKIDVIGNDYRVIYDVSDFEAVSLANEMVEEIQKKSGKKLSMSNLSNPEREYEIQFGLKSGREESEKIFNMLSVHAEENIGIYSIRVVGEKIVIFASDHTSLKVAADRFADMAGEQFEIDKDFNETATFNISDYNYGNLTLVFADENGAINKPKVDVLEVEGMSKKGIDRIVGLHSIERIVIDAKEDTYISAGKNQNTNFGSEKNLLVKSMENSPSEYYRCILLKFDISSLDKIDIGSVRLELNCTAMQDVADHTPVHIYGCNPADWNENETTYNSAPEREELLGTVLITGKGKMSFDISDYVRHCMKYGDKEISVLIDGDNSMSRVLTFSSRESGENVPVLDVYVGEHTFSTEIEYVGENPWDVAMECYSDWSNRWEEIKARGDDDIEVVEYDDSEFSLTVGAATVGKTDGAKTQYTDYKTRLVSTLKGYENNTSETAKLDKYGGLMDESLKQEATGFFYSKKIDGRWWTIDPLGYPFFRTAVNTLVAREKVSLAQYETMDSWAKATTDRLRELGFNTAGCWSDVDTLIRVEQPLAQTTRHMRVMSTYASECGLNVSQSGTTDLLHNLMPVFDPNFKVSADKSVKETVSKYAGESYIYGWISDNELPQAQTMLDSYLALDPTDARFSYSYATAWTFMFMRTGKINVSVADITDELRLEFRAMIYDKYFSVVRDALDRYAPYHQYMGSRFLPGCYGDEKVMRVAGYWCDVITFNYYERWTASNTLLANQAKWAGKPVIVTEWYAKGMDVWEKDNRMTNKSGAGWTVKDQDARGMFYQNFALSLMETGCCVGFDWFLYWDNDPEDKSADLSNRDSNKGLIDNNGNEYTVFTSYISELNNQKYNIISFMDER